MVPHPRLLSDTDLPAKVTASPLLWTRADLPVVLSIASSLLAVLGVKKLLAPDKKE